MAGIEFAFLNAVCKKNLSHLLLFIVDEEFFLWPQMKHAPLFCRGNLFEVSYTEIFCCTMYSKLNWNISRQRWNLCSRYEMFFHQRFWKCSQECNSSARLFMNIVQLKQYTWIYTYNVHYSIKYEKKPTPCYLRHRISCTFYCRCQHLLSSYSKQEILQVSTFPINFSFVLKARY